MTIGDVFARAWDLWRRDVGWLILAGLVVGVTIGVLSAVVYGIILALVAGAGTAVAVDSANDSSSALSGLGVGLGVTGLLIGLVGGFLIQVLAWTFYGGLFEMVIGAYRQQRGVEFGDLFAGFRKFGSYALFALVLTAIQFGLGLLGILPFIGQIIALVVWIWLMITWLYVLPAIADHGLSFMGAAGKSTEMVKSAGWWWTLGRIVLLILAAVVLLAIITALAILFGKADTAVGVAVAVILLLVFAVLFPPYSICYVSVLYVASGGDIVTVPAGGGMGAIPPAPPAPPAYGGQAYGTPPAYSMPPGTPASAEAWKAAADPLAAPPPPPLVVGGQMPATGAPPVVDATAVTQASPASDAPAATPDMPEPPAPPAPPGI
jgi:hypothetical protein